MGLGALWLQASLAQGQRFQQLFFLEGMAFDGQLGIGVRLMVKAQRCRQVA